MEHHRTGTHTTVEELKHLLAAGEFSHVISCVTTYYKDISTDSSLRAHMYAGIAEARVGLLSDSICRLSTILQSPSLSAEVAAHIHRHLGNSLAMTGNLAEALRHYTVAKDWYEANNRPDLVASCQGNIGAMFTQAGLFDESISYFAHAQRFYGMTGNGLGTTRMMCNQGFARFHSGDKRSGIVLVLRALQMSLALGDVEVLGRTYLMLAGMYRHNNRIVNLRSILSKAKQVCYASTVLKVDWLLECCQYLITTDKLHEALSVARFGYANAYSVENRNAWVRILSRVFASLKRYEEANCCHVIRDSLHGSTSRDIVEVARVLASLEATRIEQERQQSVAHARKLKRLNNNLQRALHHKNELLQFVSHDLKTPLTSIQLATDVLLNYYASSLSAKVKQLLMSISTNSSKQNLLIENLLGVEGPSSQSIEPTTSTFKLCEILDRLIVECRNLIEHKRQQVSIACNRYVLVHSDSTLFSLLLQNILTNAINYTQKDGEIVVAYNNSSHELTISDNGPGIQGSQRRGTRHTRNVMTSHGLGNRIIEKYSTLLRIKVHVASSELGTSVCLNLANIRTTTAPTTQTHGS